MRLTIQQVYVADGFVDDCDELIHKCMQVETLTYQTFCGIWKKMNFAQIFQGRASGPEIAELSEEVLHIAKRYMVVNTHNFKEAIAGLFLVYALLNLQPFSGFAPLRIIPNDVAAIKELEKSAREGKRYDVLYILGSILIQGPVQYHVEERERGMEGPIKKYLEGLTSIDKHGIRPKGVFHRQNEEIDLLRDLNSISKRYTIAKSLLAVNGTLDKSLMYTDENLSSELDSSLKRLINGIPEKDSDSEDYGPSSSYSSSAQGIKEKAMKNVVGGMKHLTSTVNSDNTTSQLQLEVTKKKTSPAAKKKKKTTPYSPQKHIPGKKRTREEMKYNTEKYKRRKYHKFNSDSEEEDEFTEISDDDTEIVEDREIRKEPVTEYEVPIVNPNEQFVQLLSAMPGTNVTIQNNIEIEFIDMHKSNINKENKTKQDKNVAPDNSPSMGLIVDATPETNDKSNEREALNSSEEVSSKKKDVGGSKKVGAKRISARLKSCENPKQDALPDTESFKVPENLKNKLKKKQGIVLERRDIKKIRNKSKLEHTRILPATNLKK